MKFYFSRGQKELYWSFVQFRKTTSYILKWDKVFKNGQSEICERPPLK